MPKICLFSFLCIQLFSPRFSFVFGLTRIKLRYERKVLQVFFKRLVLEILGTIQTQNLPIVSDHLLEHTLTFLFGQLIYLGKFVGQLTISTTHLKTLPSLIIKLKSPNFNRILLQVSLIGSLWSQILIAATFWARILLWRRCKGTIFWLTPSLSIILNTNASFLTQNNIIVANFLFLIFLWRNNLSLFFPYLIYVDQFRL